MFPVNRVVAFLTPVFTAGAAVASGWLLKHAPGVPAPSVVELTGVEVTAATAAAGAALKWLHGHQKYEADIRWADQAVKAASRDAEKLNPGITSYVEQLVKGEVEKLKPELPAPLQTLVNQGLATVAASPDGKDGPQVALATQASEAAAQAAPVPTPPAAAVAPVQGA